MTAREALEWQLTYAMQPVGEDAANIRTALLLMPHVDPKRRARTELWDVNPLIPKPADKTLSADATVTAFDSLFGLVDPDGRTAC